MTNNNQSKTKSRIHLLVECAMMVALATVLSLIKVYDSPYGGSITLLSMAPVILISFRHGVGTGLVTGFVYSVIQLLLGLNNVAWVPDLAGKLLCVLFDYIIPFTALGFAGIFRKLRFSSDEKKNLVIAAIVGTLVVTVFRYVCHIFSGVVVWYALDLEWYADDPEHIVNRYSAFVFSAIYNGIFMIPEIIETTIGVPLLAPVIEKIKK